MLRKIHFCLLAGLIFTPAFSQQRVVDYVNPIIGTNGMGHTFPGPCVPFGLIQLSPDTDTIPHNINGEYQKDVYKYCAGYQYSDPTIVGFSHTHLSGTADYNYAKKSMELTHRWLDRCITRFNETEPKYGYQQSLFPIVQGCVYPDLRRRSAEYIASKNADGNAIGGLAVGEPTEKMYEMIEVVNEILPTDKPRYLMGVGTPVNILEGIERGVDMFDCVMPTRNGRNGMLFTKDGIMNMRNKKWENDFSPIEADGASYVDTMYSRAYLRHLFHAQELLALQIASIHNLAFYLWLVGEARKHIIAGDFSTWKPAMVKRISTRL